MKGKYFTKYFEILCKLFLKRKNLIKSGIKFTMEQLSMHFVLQLLKVQNAWTSTTISILILTTL